MLDSDLVSISGAWVESNEPNRRWDGEAHCDHPFVALLVAKCDDGLHWAKMDARSASDARLMLDVHPLRDTKPNTQLIFMVGGAWIDHATAHVLDRFGEVRAVLPASVSLGEYCEAFVVEGARQTTLGVLFVAREDVVTGRTGVWKPKNQTLGRFPEQLLVPLGGGRRGLQSSI